MEDVASALMRGGLLAAGLLLPGLGWARGLRCPLPWFFGAVLSSLAILAAILAFDLFGIPTNLLSLTGWLAVVALTGWRWGRRRARDSRLFCLPEREGWWWALPAVPSACVALWRAVVQPLSGADVDFRWGHLARLIAEKGSLDYYPPVLSDDFALYFWADGIAPLVSGTYAWAYLCAESVAEIWTAIPVLLQFLGLYVLLHALGKCWGGSRAGWTACGLGGATMLLQFSFGLGQETGLTTIGGCGMVFYLVKFDEDRSLGTLVAAGACAGLAACAREYGLAFVVVGAAWVLFTIRSPRSFFIFAVVAGVLPVYWHARNWIVTGNPLYAQDVSGIFPVNPVFNSWMQGYVEIYGAAFSRGNGWREIARYVLIGALPVVLGLSVVAVAWRIRVDRGWGVSIVIGVTACVVWVASIPFTAGGLFYSMRVLGPVLLLGCTWAAGFLVKYEFKVWCRPMFIGMFALGADAAARALTVPQNPYGLPVRDWLYAGDVLQTDFLRNDLPFLERVAREVDGKVLSESAGVQHPLRSRGIVVTPLWSPDVAFLFEHDSSGDATSVLLEKGYTHVLLTRSQYSADFLAEQGVLTRLGNVLKPILSNETFVLFAIKRTARLSSEGDGATFPIDP